MQCPTQNYIRMNTNSLLFKRLAIYPKTFRESSLKKQTKRNLCVRMHQEKKDCTEEIHHSQLKSSKRWLGNGEKNGGKLDEHIRLLAYEEFCYGEFECREFNNYACQYRDMLLRELKNNKKEIEYIRRYGSKWSVSPVKKVEFNHTDKLTEIQVRLYECEKRCEDFEKKENEFLKKISFY